MGPPIDYLGRNGWHFLTLRSKKLKPRAKAYKKADERGLYLLVTPNGSKLWKFKYRYEGKEKKLSFGAYLDVSLKKARDKRKAARELLADGIEAFLGGLPVHSRLLLL